MLFGFLFLGVGSLIAMMSDMCHCAALA